MKIRTLVIAPTRELAEQTAQWVESLTQLPTVVGSSIANALATTIKSGIFSGNFKALNGTDIPNGEQNWGYNINFYTGESTTVFAHRAASNGLWIRDLRPSG